MEGTACAIANNLMKGFGIFVMFLSLAMGTSWETPCGGPPASPPPGFPVPPPLQYVTAMRPIIDEATLKIGELKDRYIQERFNNNGVFIPIMNDFHYDGMPECCMSLEEMAQSLSNLTLVHQTNYDKISRALVFLEQVALDENLLETPSYIADVSSIQTDALNLLCNKQSLILNAGATINYVSSSVMADHVREYQNEFDRHVRDYIIIKDVDRMFNNMNVHIKAIETHLLTPGN
ncbi:uncharacterized protein LOC117338801 [Pecten maximus]|uniref:uncharacterized protein LOC117338801 n=1 Tax=Pecten maximus TaxID=6579 RepID=UPI0014583BC7|nr:uncharacterized protein LOC117338801 [Pecten maximus]